MNCKLMEKKTNIIGYWKENRILYPVILCEEREELKGAMKFWCEFCKKWHYHGIGSGHRVAHCVRDSLLSNHGYFVTLDKDYLRKLEVKRFIIQ